MTAPNKSLRALAEDAAAYVGFGECADCDRAGDDCRGHKLQRKILADKVEAACRVFAERALRHALELRVPDHSLDSWVATAIAAAEREGT